LPSRFSLDREAFFKSRFSISYFLSLWTFKPGFRKSISLVSQIYL
jgi:hypothetical protein